MSLSIGDVLPEIGTLWSEIVGEDTRKRITVNCKQKTHTICRGQLKDEN